MQIDYDDLKKRGLNFNGRHKPYNKDLKERVRYLRKNMTTHERKLWFEFLKPHAVKFVAQHPIDHYIVDFYCAHFALVIELDGSQHYTKEGQEYDHQRDDTLSMYELKVLRFSNSEIERNFLGVCQVIEECLK